MNYDKYEKKQRRKIRKQKIKEKKREAKAIKRAEKNNTTKLNSFLRTFFLFFLIFTLSLVGARAIASNLASVNLFKAPEEVIALETLVSEDSPFFDEYKEADKVNVLLLGVNQGMTDTIMLVCFDMKYKQVDVISIPRDTYYHRPGYDGLAEMKINAAYRGKATNTAKAVSDVLLGIPINYYAIVEYDGVEKIVDSMGGVPMNIPFHMVYEDPYDTPPLLIDIPEGQQILDGDHAVQFLRYRHGYPEGDIGRMKAQQEFVKSAFRQTLGFDLIKIAKTVFNNIESDITLGTSLSIATKAIGITGERIRTYMLPNYLEPNPPYYVYPDSKGIAELIEEIYKEPENTTEAGIKAD